MTFLFVLENNIAKPNVETLLISPFKEIWERDTSSNKKDAIREFTFIELMSSKLTSNPYAGYDEETRMAILFTKYFPKGGTLDPLIEQGLAKVVEFQTQGSLIYSYYMDARSAAEKLKAFFRSFSLDTKNERTGNPLYKPREITQALIDTEKTIQTLSSLEKRVAKDLLQNIKTKGNKEINPFEI